MGSRLAWVLLRRTLLTVVHLIDFETENLAEASGPTTPTGFSETCRRLSVTCPISPMTLETRSTLEWEESTQNFVISDVQ